MLCNLNPQRIETHFNHVRTKYIKKYFRQRTLTLFKGIKQVALDSMGTVQKSMSPEERGRELF